MRDYHTPFMWVNVPSVMVEPGVECCPIFAACNHLVGELAKTTSPEEVGRATGELCQAMAKVDLGDRVIPIPPYFQVFDVHHAINKEKFYQEAAKNPAFQVRMGGLLGLRV